MEEIKCPKCGAIDDYYTEIKSNNNVARCNKCNAFIKNIPYGKPMLHFGKYKGKAVEEIEDIGYLKWLLGNTKQSLYMTDAIQKQITRFENLAR